MHPDDRKEYDDFCANVKLILSNIRYKSWKLKPEFRLLDDIPIVVIYATWRDKDVNTGKRFTMASRGFPAIASDEDSVVRTAFKAIENAEAHELREKFLYKGKRIYNPHIKIETLLEVCDDEINL